MPTNDHGRATHPTAENAEYSDEEMEFLKAMEKARTRIRRISQRSPTFVDVLAVAVAMGYRRLSKEECAAYDALHGEPVVGCIAKRKSK